MSDDSATLHIRLNVLGPLELIQGQDDHRDLPNSARAKVLLALFALKERYERLALVRILWPHHVSIYTDRASSVDSIKSIDNNLDGYIGEARKAFDLYAHSGFLFAHQRIVKRARDNKTVEVTSDYDDFIALSRPSASEEDLRSALKLVRGEVAKDLSMPRDVSEEWRTTAQEHQKEDIGSILVRLHPQATASERDILCKKVLQGRYVKPQGYPSPTGPYAEPVQESAEPDPAAGEGIPDTDGADDLADTAIQAETGTGVFDSSSDDIPAPGPRTPPPPDQPTDEAVRPPDEKRESESAEPEPPEDEDIPDTDAAEDLVDIANQAETGIGASDSSDDDIPPQGPRTPPPLDQSGSPSGLPIDSAGDELTPTPYAEPEPERAKPEPPEDEDIPDTDGAEDFVGTAVRTATGNGALLTRHRGRTTIAAVCVLLLALGGYILVRQSESQAQSSATQLGNLEAAADRQLPLAATPVPGTRTPTLGYGDSVGGRHTYPYGEPEVLPSNHPVLDSLVDVPDPEPIGEPRNNPNGSRYHTIDERHFLTVRADQEYNGIIPKFAWGHGALVTTGSSPITVGIWVSNDARPNKQECRKLVGPDVATNVRVQVSIWNSGNYRRHIIRAWIEAGAKTSPTWITDAVPVLTAKSAELHLEPRDSGDVIGKMTYGTIPPPDRAMSNDAILLPHGYLLPSNGRLGPCKADRHYLSLVFTQRKPVTIPTLP